MQAYLILHYLSFATNFLVNCFTLYIVFVKTPKNMRNVAASITNIIVWNFAGNLVWGMMPFYPLFPLNCYQLQGPFGRFLAHHNLQNYGFILIVLFFLNACVGVQLSFQFRWIQIAAPERIKKLKRCYAYIYSLGTHLWASALFFSLSNQVFVSKAEYPDFDSAYNSTPVFCMTPEKSRFTVLLCAIVVSVLLASTVIVALVLLCYKSLVRQRHILSTRTLKIQKSFLRNLIILALISICLGALPCTVAWFCYLSHTPCLELLCIGAMFVVINHGTALDIAALVVFRYYRTAAVQLLGTALGKKVFPSMIAGLKSISSSQGIITVHRY